MIIHETVEDCVYGICWWCRNIAECELHSVKFPYYDYKFTKSLYYWPALKNLTRKLHEYGIPYIVIWEICRSIFDGRINFEYGIPSEKNQEDFRIKFIVPAIKKVHDFLNK